jgi:hypothetical protein
MTPVYSHCSFRGEIGAAATDITPEPGIYCRNWGAADHDAAVGIHRPLQAAALALAAADGAPLVLVSLDLGWWRSLDVEREFRASVLAALDLPPEALMIALSHTHSTPPLANGADEWEGGEHLAPYRERVRQAVISIARTALDNRQPGVLDWHTGHCQLATNRDLEAPVAGDNRTVCGYNPHVDADSTLVVGRATAADGTPLATIVNYACHPTTLAWENNLVSPDFIGAMAELVSDATAGAPCLFLQGASGELSPRLQYVGDTAVADRHGRQLGYAVLSVLADMETPACDLVFDRIVESGAPLAVWQPQPAACSETLAAAKPTVELPLRAWESETDLNEMHGRCDTRALEERLRRRRDLRKSLGDGDTYAGEAWIWRLGDAIVVGQMNEAYSWLQQTLRRRFPQHTVVVMNLVNGTAGYLPPEGLYTADVYQVWQSPFGPGALEKTADACSDTISELLRPW